MLPFLNAIKSKLRTFAKFYQDYYFGGFRILLFILIPGASGAINISFSLCVELLGGKYKTIYGQLMMLGFTVGQVIIGIVAIFIRSYKTFQILLSIPCFVLLGAYFIVPESPRWLISKKRYSEAEAVVERMCRFNKVKKHDVDTISIFHSLY